MFNTPNRLSTPGRLATSGNRGFLSPYVVITITPLCLAPMDGYQRLFNLFRQYQSLSFKRRRNTTMLTLWVRRTPHRAFCQGVLLGCFASFPFAFCSCLVIFCFRPLFLSFLPLSPISYLLFPCPSSSRRKGAAATRNFRQLF